jgi:hypothetical protein
MLIVGNSSSFIYMHVVLPVVLRTGESCRKIKERGW